MHAAVNFGVGSWIERHARVIPDHPALVGDGYSVTYAHLAGRVRRLANGLSRLGVSRGDRVVWLGSNHPAFLESLFACGLVGAALAPVNHRLPAGAISAILDGLSARVLIEHDVADLVPPAGAVRHRVSVADAADGALDYETLVAESAEHAVDVSVEM